eukprot:4443316-Amphidinium_carterae.1
MVQKGGGLHWPWRANHSNAQLEHSRTKLDACGRFSQCGYGIQCPHVLTDYFSKGFRLTLS